MEARRRLAAVRRQPDGHRPRPAHRALGGLRGLRLHRPPRRADQPVSARQDEREREEYWRERDRRPRKQLRARGLQQLRRGGALLGRRRRGRRRRGRRRVPREGSVGADVADGRLPHAPRRARLPVPLRRHLPGGAGEREDVCGSRGGAPGPPLHLQPRHPGEQREEGGGLAHRDPVAPHERPLAPPEAGPALRLLARAAAPALRGAQGPHPLRPRPLREVQLPGLLVPGAQHVRLHHLLGREQHELQGGGHPHDRLLLLPRGHLLLHGHGPHGERVPPARPPEGEADHAGAERHAR
mmetsp:Transcript_23643/g.70348  ORF Transcript_23643/g.70348 Transcript_23643/m.70348 type:complete len:297 (-) Transcript_23643:1157-2047(-)